MAAHNDQRCNSSKDVSVQHFGGEFFKDNFTKAYGIYQSLPAPKPTNTHRPAPRGTIRQGAVSNYASYNCSGPCFLAKCKVSMADGTLVNVDEIKQEDEVVVPNINCWKKFVLVKYFKFVFTLENRFIDF